MAMYLNENLVKRFIETKLNQTRFLKGHSVQSHVENMKTVIYKVSVLWNIALKVLKKLDSEAGKTELYL